MKKKKKNNEFLAKSIFEIKITTCLNKIPQKCNKITENEHLFRWSNNNKGNGFFCLVETKNKKINKDKKVYNCPTCVPPHLLLLL